LIARKTGLKEEVLWDDLKKVKSTELKPLPAKVEKQQFLEATKSRSRREVLEERLTEVRQWLSELHETSPDRKEIAEEEKELLNHLETLALKDELSQLTMLLRQAETSKDEMKSSEIALKIQELHKKVLALEG
jgi:hypothetical protein